MSYKILKCSSCNNKGYDFEGEFQPSGFVCCECLKYTCIHCGGVFGFNECDLTLDGAVCFECGDQMIASSDFKFNLDIWVECAVYGKHCASCEDNRCCCAAFVGDSWDLRGMYPESKPASVLEFVKPKSSKRSKSKLNKSLEVI